MKQVTLTRIVMDPGVTLGFLEVDGKFISFTVERPWLDNEPNVSCIPTGNYRLVKCPTGRKMPDKYFGVTYEVMGVEGRTLIKIHIGNHPFDVKGCIAPNMSISAYTSSGGYSAIATQRFMDAMVEDGELVEEARILVRSVVDNAPDTTKET